MYIWRGFGDNRPMKHPLLAKISLALLSLVVALVLCEGVRSLFLMQDEHTSLVHSVYRHWKRARGSPSVDASIGGARPFLWRREDLAALVPDLLAARAGVGNTDFRELASELSSAKRAQGCGMKPNLRKTMVQIRSLVFDPQDPPTVFFDRQVALSAPLEKFLATYGFSRVDFSTDENGYRLTLPRVRREGKVLVAGDSVALGLGVSDEETLASRLQRADPSRQYVNLGVSDVGTQGILCQLEEAARRYEGAIEELIYVVCDNDYFADELGRADVIVDRIAQFRERNKFARVTVVRAPYTYSIPPLHRWRPQILKERAEARRLAEASVAAGFTFVDIKDLALDEAAAQRTLFGAFSLFVDHAHLSPLGTDRLAAKLRAKP